LLGIFLSYIGIYWIDGVVGIGISIWIGFTGVKVFLSSYQVLMDTNINEGFKEDVIKAIEDIDGVDHVDDVFAKPVGIGYILIVKVSVLGDMTVNQSHGIAARIREKIKEGKNVMDVVVHVNPV
jgi:divalent metal cation (Fe/Co/Zn/Cd) transporter